MIKYRVNIVALPDTEKESTGLYESLKPHDGELTVSSAYVNGKDLWSVDFGTDIGEDDLSIEQLQEFIDKLKDAHAKVGSPESE